MNFMIQPHVTESNFAFLECRIFSGDRHNDPARLKQSIIDLELTV